MANPVVLPDIPFIDIDIVGAAAPLPIIPINIDTMISNLETLIREFVEAERTAI